ncbi:exported hypothetical protein [uncultured Desulfovibrio sp.]|uniref:Uncharacterized protein n=1 Tax=uncultured Desulfovibrio sp. TaxID=167968 RepID=A0A212KD32_9BACT|nr:exported hypothetical protein [uncultured Desulfovibrio sp.]
MRHLMGALAAFASVAPIMPVVAATAAVAPIPAVFKNSRLSILTSSKQKLFIHRKRLRLKNALNSGYCPSLALMKWH